MDSLTRCAFLHFLFATKSTTWKLLFFFLLINIRSSLPAGTERSVCISKSQRTLCASFAKTDSGLWIYHFVIWSNFNISHKYQWITFPTKLWLVIHSFCARLLYPFIMWFTLSSLSPHNLNLLILLRIVNFRYYFLSWGLFFLTKSMCSRVQFRQFVVWNIVVFFLFLFCISCFLVFFFFCC